MASYKHRVANPTPLLAIVNPKGGKMATKRKTAAAAKGRKKTTRRAALRTTTRATFRANPSTARKRTATKTKKQYTHRRNPSSTLATEIFDFSIAGVGLGIAQPFVAPMIARFLPLGQFTQPAAAAISGYGLGWLAEKFALTRRYGRPLKVLGVSAAVIGLVNPIVRGFIGGGGTAQAPAQQGMQGGGWNRPIRRGLNGIAVMTDVPPSIVPLPPPKPQTNGMNGIAAVPGRYAR